jgi:beta-lactamase superfamily II metal-dependent hydrolase
MRRVAFSLAFVAQIAFSQKVGEVLPRWVPGMLDIHQIQTGRGNAAYFVFPDGSTMLLDAGAVPERAGLELGPERPDGSHTPGEWIARYIQQFSPRTPATLDYAVITHYHDDHMGAIQAVGALVPIGTLIDRGDDPAPVAGKLIDEYRVFRRTFGGKTERLRAGRSDQIGRAYPDFEVRNVAVNGEIWTGAGTETRQVFPKSGQPNENDFSIALRIRYGRFRYYTGGDLMGVPLDHAPAWQDLETPVARAIGVVDVMVANHHGWLDSTNDFFIETLRPRVVVIPAWHASHPDHGVLRRLLSDAGGPRDLFITTLLDAPRAIFRYLGEPFKSTEGHIVIRVAPGGGSYTVVILDDKSEAHPITAIHGPYESR